MLVVTSASQAHDDQSTTTESLEPEAPNYYYWNMLPFERLNTVDNAERHDPVFIVGYVAGKVSDYSTT